MYLTVLGVAPLAQNSWSCLLVAKMSKPTTLAKNVDVANDTAKNMTVTGTGACGALTFAGPTPRFACQAIPNSSMAVHAVAVSTVSTVVTGNPPTRSTHSDRWNRPGTGNDLRNDPWQWSVRPFLQSAGAFQPGTGRAGGRANKFHEH